MSNSKVISPVTGSVWKLLCREGDQVGIGQELMIIESMKTEFPITAEVAGTISGLTIREGDPVEEDAAICEIEES